MAYPCPLPYSRTELRSGKAKPWSVPRSSPRRRRTWVRDIYTTISRSVRPRRTRRTRRLSIRSLCTCLPRLFPSTCLPSLALSITKIPIQSTSELLSRTEHSDIHARFMVYNSFESHFTEIKYGLLSSESSGTDNTLRWMANSETQWSTDLVPGQWYNLCVFFCPSS